jgi:type II secretory pathway component PulF
MGSFFRLMPAFGEHGPDLSTAEQLVKNLSDWLLLLAVGAAVIMIIIGAYYYILSFGNADRATKGKTIIIWAIIGMAVVIMAKVIINFAINLAGKGDAAKVPSGLFENPVVK